MEKERYGSLDFLRIIATLGIVFHHYQYIFNLSFPTGINFCGGDFYWGLLVELFFILSGFFMLRSVKLIGSGEVTFASFMGRRIKRLVPMMVITALAYELLCVIIQRIYPDVQSFVLVNVFATLETMLCVNCGWVFDNEFWVNSPTWYVSVLMLCYVVFYLVTYICKKKKINPVCGYLFMILTGCGILSFCIELPFFNYESARGYRCFFLGVLLAMAMEKYELHRPLYIVLCLGICLITAMGLLSDTLSMGFIAYPAILILFTAKPVKKLFSGKLWTTFGNIQFHVYVWHMTGLMVLVFLRRAGVSLPIESRMGMFVFAVIMELWGTFSYFVLEKPALRLMQWLLPKEKDYAGN